MAWNAHVSPQKTHASSQTWVHETPSIFGVEKQPIRSKISLKHRRWSNSTKGKRLKKTELANKNGTQKQFFYLFWCGDPMTQWYTTQYRGIFGQILVEKTTVVFQKQETYMRLLLPCCFSVSKILPQKNNVLNKHNSSLGQKTTSKIRFGTWSFNKPNSLPRSHFLVGGWIPSLVVFYCWF